jgi:hypothetical protein
MSILCKLDFYGAKMFKKNLGFGFSLKRTVVHLIKTLIINIVLLYFIEYSVHFFTLKMMLKYSLRTIHGR